ncbi:PRC-barrel domain-containing protein [Symbioplanes lichenis]|uniref:PRC-barrel domain-containing protein n=1 Tax=Symbioplanes lichenis TaxID=1629072 RepID=UPI0027389EAF|nr:PRC-barrel domain-containing protein [Actinoplanes lichenis]
MAETNTAPEDLGAPQSFLVLADGTPVYDRSGEPAGSVAHVLADDKDEIFQGLVLKTGDGHRFAAASQIDGIFERAVIIGPPAKDLPEPSENATSDDSSLADGLRRAWHWLVQPK